MSEAVVTGHFGWHERLSANPDAAKVFYDKVFGWKAAVSQGNPAYTLLSNANRAP